MSYQLPMFYETTMLSPHTREKAIKIATNQSELILKVFKLYDHPFTPIEIQAYLEKMGHKILITSIRRSISTLTRDGYLIKLATQKMEKHGMPNNQWKLARR